MTREDKLAVALRELEGAERKYLRYFKNARKEGEGHPMLCT